MPSQCRINRNRLARDRVMNNTVLFLQNRKSIKKLKKKKLKYGMILEFMRGLYCSSVNRMNANELIIATRLALRIA